MALTGAALVVDRTGLTNKVTESYERREYEQFEALLEKEKVVVKKLIVAGVSDANAFQELKLKIHKLVETLRPLTNGTDSYKKLVGELNQANHQADTYYWESGIELQAPFIEANAFADELLHNEAAITALSTARVSYRVGLDRVIGLGNQNFELAYHHNCVRAYLDLGQKTATQVKEKMKLLVQQVEHVQRLPSEKILYYLLDDGFDLSLTPEKMKNELGQQFPHWDKHLPTHQNKETYEHFNDLSVFDLFELNQLRAVMTQLNSPRFISTLFTLRDQDLKDTTTEHGGVVPLPLNDRHIHDIPTAPHFDNEAYIPGPKLDLEAFRSAASFHFHATQLQEPPSVQGPSGADTASFEPEVVFTSVNEKTILAHFYKSRDAGDRKLHNDIVCLGEIHR